MPQLKDDYANKPLSIFTQELYYKNGSMRKRHVMLVETFNDQYDKIKDDIVSISQAVQRCQHIHEYELSTDTIQAGISLGKQPRDILQVLNENNKYVQIPQELQNFLQQNEQQANRTRAIYFQILDINSYLVRIPKSLQRIINEIGYSTKLSSSTYDKISFLRYNMQRSNEQLEYKTIERENMIDLRERIERYIKEKQLDFNIVFLEEYYETKQITENGVYQQLPEQETTVKNEPFGDQKLNLVDVLRKQEKNEFNNDDQEQQRRVNDYLRRFDPMQVAIAKQVIKYNTEAPILNAKLKSTTSLRDYQKYAVMRVVNTHQNIQNDRWSYLPPTSSYNSGLIILPCGSGKTLTGIAIAINVQQACLVLTNSNISSLQWKNEFKKYTTIGDQNIFVFSSENTGNVSTIYQPGFHQVVISTYQMLTNEKANPKARFNQTLIRNTLFGTILFDEAHLMFAKTYQRLWIPKNMNIKNDQQYRYNDQFIASKCKVGLTATPLREDDTIEEKMKYLGVKLYEANWYELQQKGYLAPIKCIEIKVEPNQYIPEGMSMETFRELSKGGMLRLTQDENKEYGTGTDERRLLKYLTIMPYSKIRVLIQLLKFHLSLSHQIIIFVDQVESAKFLGLILYTPVLWGDVQSSEREIIINAFLQREINLIILTRVGDTSLDLPECNVLIQLSWQEGSNRQETQRMGRISRPKSSGETGYFYILVNGGAENEVKSAEKRRQYTTQSQGYSYISLTEEDIKVNYEARVNNRNQQENNETNLYNFHEFKDEEEYVNTWKRIIYSRGGHSSGSKDDARGGIAMNMDILNNNLDRD